MNLVWMRALLLAHTPVPLCVDCSSCTLLARLLPSVLPRSHRNHASDVQDWLVLAFWPLFSPESGHVHIPDVQDAADLVPGEAQHGDNVDPPVLDLLARGRLVDGLQQSLGVR